jgi:hypothetical protein
VNSSLFLLLKFVLFLLMYLLSITKHTQTHTHTHTHNLLVRLPIDFCLSKYFLNAVRLLRWKISLFKCMKTILGHTTWTDAQAPSSPEINDLSLRVPVVQLLLPIRSNARYLPRFSSILSLHHHAIITRNVGKLLPHYTEQHNRKSSPSVPSP